MRLGIGKEKNKFVFREGITDFIPIYKFYRQVCCFNIFKSFRLALYRAFTKIDRPDFKPTKFE